MWVETKYAMGQGKINKGLECSNPPNLEVFIIILYNKIYKWSSTNKSIIIIALVDNMHFQHFFL